VARALALVADGAFDEDDAGIDDVAERLGVGGRQLRRLFRTHLGASPISVVQTRRVLFAKQLLHETQLSMAEVSIAAGFGSIRRFNEVFRDLYGRPPSALRRTVGPSARGRAPAEGVTMRLRYRPPYDWSRVLAYLASRAVPGMERVGGDTYERTFAEGDARGTVRVTHAPAVQSLVATVRVSSVSALPAVVARIRRTFDLRADVASVAAHLARDPWLAPLVRKRPGLRVGGGWDGFELAVRAVLGQQVTVGAGRKLVGHLVRLCNVAAPGEDPGLSLSFPDAARVTSTDLGPMGMPAARKEALHAIARAASSDPHLFRPGENVEATVARLRAIRGVGDWTAQYIALRATHEPDAFPAGDVVLQRSASERAGAAVGIDELRARSERWRPWRAYAAAHLWAAASDSRSDRGDYP
jgi:AraC family transcriptional regulator of adaptative response / DNA-3-methyladenine glycosylase II